MESWGSGLRGTADNCVFFLKPSFFIRTLKFVGKVFGIGFPILWFVLNKEWKHRAPAIIGTVLFLISAWMFSIGGTAGAILGVFCWVFGMGFWGSEELNKK